MNRNGILFNIRIGMVCFMPIRMLNNLSPCCICSSLPENVGSERSPYEAISSFYAAYFFSSTHFAPVLLPKWILCSTSG